MSSRRNMFIIDICMGWISRRGFCPDRRSGWKRLKTPKEKAINN